MYYPSYKKEVEEVEEYEWTLAAEVQLTYNEVDAVDPGLLSYLRVHPEVFEGSPPVIDLPHPLRLQKVD